MGRLSIVPFTYIASMYLTCQPLYITVSSYDFTQLSCRARQHVATRRVRDWCVPERLLKIEGHLILQKFIDIWMPHQAIWDDILTLIISHMVIPNKVTILLTKKQINSVIPFSWEYSSLGEYSSLQLWKKVVHHLYISLQSNVLHAILNIK